MQKNTVWAIVLSTIVMVAFFVIQIKFFPAQNQVQTTSSQKTEIVENTNNSVSESKLSGLEDFSDSETVETKTVENFVIETNILKVTFTNQGGDVVGFELKSHKDRDTNKGVEMVNNVSAMNRAFALSFGNIDSSIVNSVFDVKIDEKNHKIGFVRDFGTFTLYKVYSFKDDEYLFKLDVEVVGKDGFKGLDYNGAAYSLRTSPQIGPKFNPKDRYDVREFVAYDAVKDKDFTPKAKNEKDWTWVGLAGKYFEILINPNDTVKTLNGFKLITPEGSNTDNQLVFSRAATTSSNISDSYYIYVGPRSDVELKKYVSAENNSWNISNARYTESLPTSGILNWLEIILKFIMQLFYKLIPNWGVSIIIMTVLLKLALFPLSKKSLEGTQKMQVYQPKIQALKEKYKNNPQQFNQETMKLYKEIGYNPMAGCLPLIVQFVVLWAMYHLFNNYFEFRGASFIDGWISDLSSTDNVYTLGFEIPWLGNEIHLLPVIYLASQLLYGKITQNGGTAMTQSAAQMKMMMYAMPVFFFFLFYNAPSGLLLYWTVSNIFQLGQQLVINRIMKNKPIAPTNAKSMSVFKKNGKNKK